MASNRNHRNKPEPKPEPQAKFKLRPVEMVGIGALLFIILVFTFRSCGSNNPTPNNNPNTANGSNDSTNQQNANLPTANQLRPLYVVIDSIKLRPKPQLDSTFIRHLVYDEIVYDMAEQTNFVQTIRYSMDDVRTEPWVKIKTKTGETGWVFGAGVSFYRKKRTGVPNVSVSNTTATIPSTANTPRTTTTQPSTPPRDTSRNLNRPIRASGNR